MWEVGRNRVDLLKYIPKTTFLPQGYKILKDSQSTMTAVILD